MPELNPDHKRLVVTGSRTFWNASVIQNRIEYAVSMFGVDPFFVVHGACPTGADAIADRYCRHVGTWPIIRYPANWSEGRYAGVKRDHRMIDEGADILLAFLMPCSKAYCTISGQHYSHGASGCIKYALTKNIRVLAYDIDGKEINLSEFQKKKKIDSRVTTSFRLNEIDPFFS